MGFEKKMKQKIDKKYSMQCDNYYRSCRVHETETI